MVREPGLKGTGRGNFEPSVSPPPSLVPHLAVNCKSRGMNNIVRELLKAQTFASFGLHSNDLMSNVPLGQDAVISFIPTSCFHRFLVSILFNNALI